jgi:hypothetical protein
MNFGAGSDGSRFFPSSRSEERAVLYVLKRRATAKWGKLAPFLRVPSQHAETAYREPWVAAQIRPYLVLALDLGTTKAFGLGLVSTPRTRTCPWGPRSDRIFARNAVCPKVSNRP